MFHAARAVCFDHIELCVGQQRKIQVVLGSKLSLSLDGISTASHYRRVLLGKALHRVTKLGRFVRSTRRVGFWEKIKNERFSTIRGKRYRPTVVRCRLKVGRFVAFF